ncbi:MAG: phosphoglycerate kinase [Alphaproteobacteria bacterium]|nr:phosphoglycerate kinase [Alphaproteobacteria bacterium]
MNRFKTLGDFDFSGKRVLVRADLNVPMQDGAVSDATRIERFAPTAALLASKGARVVVLSHFGRPKGRDESQSLRPLVAALSKAVGRKVAFADDCIGPAARSAVDALKPGDVALLENLRFHKGEEKNEPAFVKALAELGDIYVNDAFSCAHRAHASTEGLAHALPCAAGLLMQAELDALSKALEHPQRPVAAVVGGSKISTKLDLIGNLIQRVDILAIGGGMANTFLHAKGIGVGRSLCEVDMAETARRIMADAESSGRQIVLPVDAVVAGALTDSAGAQTVPIGRVPADKMILDIGPLSVAETLRIFDGARTLVWNGPVGAFEHPPFDKGTTALARGVAERTKAGKLMSVAGGGDTVAALVKAGAVDSFGYVSTAGGAFLEWLEGKELPGVAALSAR